MPQWKWLAGLLLKPQPQTMTNQTEEVQTTQQESNEEQVESSKQMSQRAHDCSDKINVVLKEFNCDIQPYFIQPEAVGLDGDKVILSCTYGIRPLTQEVSTE